MTGGSYTLVRVNERSMLDYEAELLVGRDRGRLQHKKKAEKEVSKERSPRHTVNAPKPNIRKAAVTERAMKNAA